MQKCDRKGAAKNEAFPAPARRPRHSQEKSCCGNAAAMQAGLGRRLAPFLAA